MSNPKKGLGSKGRGLGALFDVDMNTLEAGETVMQLELDKVYPNPNQPRRVFEEEALTELAASIAQMGMIQPVVVRQVGDSYELIAGERRWRAARIAGLTQIPAIVKTLEDAQAFQMALVENVQREDLNPLEEAQSYARLAQEFGMTQEEIAEKVGKNRATVANALRLLQLDERVQRFLSEGKLSAGHGRSLLPLPSGDAQFEMAERILEEGLSVRAVEAEVKKYLEMQTHPEKAAPPKSSPFAVETYKGLEKQLRDQFGTRVRIHSGLSKGKIELEFYSNEDLDRLLGLLKGPGAL